MDQSSCLDVLELANCSVQKLREMSKLFCRGGNLSEMLALLKRTFIEPVGSNTVGLLDRILSMDHVFEFLFRDRFEPAAFVGLSKIYDLCSGRDFSVTYETDPDFVKKLAEVGLYCEVLILAF
jgi:hypothetical protein